MLQRKNLFFIALIVAVLSAVVFIYLRVAILPEPSNHRIVSRVEKNIILRESELAFILGETKHLCELYKGKSIRIDLPAPPSGPSLYISGSAGDSARQLVSTPELFRKEFASVASNLGLKRIASSKDMFWFTLRDSLGTKGCVHLLYKKGQAPFQFADVEGLKANYEANKKCDWLYQVDENWAVYFSSHP